MYCYKLGKMAKNRINETKEYLFVYGTLKSGEGNHRYITSSNTMKKVCDDTVKGFALHVNFIPFLVRTVGDSTTYVEGELYEYTDINDITPIDSMERMSGYTPETIYTCGGYKATAYVRRDMYAEVIDLEDKRVLRYKQIVGEEQIELNENVFSFGGDEEWDD